MRIDIVTIFPGMFVSPLGESIIKRAREKGLLEVHFHDIRDFTEDKHRSVDDTPYGGGAGMVMKAAPVVAAVESVPKKNKALRVLLTPQGERLNQKIVKELSQLDQMIFVCPRYEGIDERAVEIMADREISIGDYILSGGELPAMVLLDAVVRLIPGVLGNEESIKTESFEKGLLEYPHYTRPPVFEGKKVPKVLKNGDHAQIEKWRLLQSIVRTIKRRPDLLDRECLNNEDLKLLEVDK